MTGTLGKANGGARRAYRCPCRDRRDAAAAIPPVSLLKSLAPAIAAAGIATLDLLETSGELLQRLRENTAYSALEMVARHFEIPESDHPIVPIMIGDAVAAAEMADRLLAEGTHVRRVLLPGRAARQGQNQNPDVRLALPR